MEREIGEIFEYNGEWYQCIGNPYNECTDCDFCLEIGRTCVRQIVGQCSMSNRSDRLSVVFKKLEKVGEPFSCNYYGDGRLVMMQEYQLFDSNVIYCYQTPPMYITDYKHKRIAIEIKQTKEDMEEKNKAKHSNSEKIGKNLKEFDLEAAKSGKPVCTRDGRKARLICFDKKGAYPIVALVNDYNEEEYIKNYDEFGKKFIGGETSDDLMMLPEKKEGWVNVYKDSVHDTKDDALIGRSKIRGYIDTIKISWEE